MAVTMLFQIYRAVQKLRGHEVLHEPAQGHGAEDLKVD
jgi:hypothetical protein